MFLPIGDTPQPPKGWVPWVTWLLITVNLLIYAVLTAPLSLKLADPKDPLLPALMQRIGAHGPWAVSRWDLVLQRWGYVPDHPTALTVVTAMFLHAGIAHLLGNMLFLAIFGDNVEHRLGRLPFLATYLGTGALATLVYGGFAVDGQAPLVGASGAIAGILGCYFLMFPQNQVRVLVWLILFRVWLVPAPIVLGVFVIVDNLLPFLLDRSGSGVAYGAHLGGFVAGVAVAAVAERVLRRASPPRSPDHTDAAAFLARAEHLEARGQTAAAFQYYVAALQRAEDPALVLRARQGLARIPLDPRLRARLRL